MADCRYARSVALGWRRLMKPAGQTRFSRWWASRATRVYWPVLPMRSVGKLLIAAFFPFGAVGFVVDLLLVKYQPLARGFFWPSFAGSIGTATLAARIKQPRLVPVLLLTTFASLWLAVRISFQSSAPLDLEG